MTLSFCHSITFRLKFSSHFSQELWGLEDWNLVHTWTVGRCIVCTGIGLLVFIRPFISSFFFLSNFQTLIFFVTLFSATVRQRRLKHGTYVDSGQMYHAYRNQAADIYSSLYFFVFFLSNFQTYKFFVTLFSETVWPRRLKLGTHVQWADVSCLPESGCCCLFIPLFFIFLLSNFQTLTFSSHFSQELWDLEDWNLARTWTVDRYIVFTRIRLLLLIHFFIFHFSFSPIFKH